MTKTVKPNRVMITLTDQQLAMLEAVRAKTGMTKSAQIQSLIAKYLEREYGTTTEKGVGRED